MSGSAGRPYARGRGVPDTVGNRPQEILLAVPVNVPELQILEMPVRRGVERPEFRPVLKRHASHDPSTPAQHLQTDPPSVTLRGCKAPDHDLRRPGSKKIGDDEGHRTTRGVPPELPPPVIEGHELPVEPLHVVQGWRLEQEPSSRSTTPENQPSDHKTGRHPAPSSTRTHGVPAAERLEGGTTVGETVGRRAFEQPVHEGGEPAGALPPD